MIAYFYLNSILILTLAKAQCGDGNTMFSPLNGFQGYNLVSNNPMPSCGLSIANVPKGIEYNNLQQLQNVQQEAHRRANMLNQESCEEKTKAMNLQREADSVRKQAQDAQSTYNVKQDQARKQASIACTIKKEAQEAQQKALNAEMQAQQTQQAAQMHMQQAVRNQVQANQDINLQNETQSLINNIKSTCYESRPLSIIPSNQATGNFIPIADTQVTQIIPQQQETYIPQTCSNCSLQQPIENITTISRPINNYNNESCGKEMSNNFLNSLLATVNSVPIISGSGCQQGSCLIGRESSMLMPTSCGSSNNLPLNSMNFGNCSASKEEIAVNQLNQCIGKTNKDLQYFAPKGVVNISDVLQLPANGPIPIFSSTCESLQAKQPKIVEGCF